MKTMEKPGETSGSTELSPTDGDAVSQATVRDANLSRRKWMRGAAAVAPMVLTLRSGALAASSMIAVKTVGTTLDVQNGRALVTNNPDLPIPMGGDICVSDPQLIGERPPYRIATSGHANGTVKVEFVNTTGQQTYYCEGGVYYSGRPVAFVSSASASSLRG
jgi:hypothetical protein